MEVELTELYSELERLRAVLKNFTDKPDIRYKVETDFKALTKMFDETEKNYFLDVWFIKQSSKRLDFLKESMFQLEREMLALVPEWCVPFPPSREDESSADFNKYADWVLRHLVYLSGFKIQFPNELRELNVALIHLRNELETILRWYHLEMSQRDVWSSCIRLRSGLHKFEMEWNASS